MASTNLCAVISCRALTKTHYELCLDAPEIANAAKPGQFVNVLCGNEHLLRRPISICETKEGLLRLVFEVRGEGTEWLSRREAGDVLDILGPLGNGVFPLFEDDPRPVLLVGGGVGVPPLLSVARVRPAHVVLGYRNEAAMILYRDFLASSDTVMIATDDGSVGTQGTVAQPVERLLEKNEYCAVMACGPKPMLRAVNDLALAKGLPCFLSMEERMGCGVGACLVCVCKTHDHGEEHNSRVCLDGPVFPAEKVVWDR